MTALVELHSPSNREQTGKPLEHLHAALGRLARRRGWARRLGVAGSAVAAFVGVLVVYFLIDFYSHLSVPVRLLTNFGLVACAAWGAVAWCWPRLNQSETLGELALLIEQDEDIDSDLVAALQFDRAGRQAAGGADSRLGSVELRSAVVSYVAEFSEQLHLESRLPTGEVLRKLGYLAVLLATLLAVVAGHPQAWKVFANRLLGGSDRHPTATVISLIEVNGEPVYERTVDGVTGAPTARRLPSTDPVEIVVWTSGIQPGSGTAVLNFMKSVVSGRRSQSVVVPLSRQAVSGTEPDRAQAPANGRIRFSAALEPLASSVEMTVRLGDDFVDQIRIVSIDPPAADLVWGLTLPAYRRVSAKGQASTSAGPLESRERHLSIPLGGTAVPRLLEVNRQLATVRCQLKDRLVRFERKTMGNDAWWIPAKDERWGPFEELVEYTFLIQCTEGLEVAPAIQGSIRVEADRPPRAALATLSRLFIPEAKPVLSYGAIDDFSLAEVELRADVTSSGRAPQSHVIGLWKADSSSAPSTNQRGEFTLDLSRLGVSAGDQVSLRIAARDERGELPAAWGTSESVAIQITDQAGLLASLLESDQQSARQLDSLIQRELGIGEAR